MPWHVVSGHADCGEGEPWAVVKDDDGSVAGCHATEDEANAQLEALYAAEGEEATITLQGEVVAPREDDTVNTSLYGVHPLPIEAYSQGKWQGILAVEGVETGDGRMFNPGALVWRDLPLSMTWQLKTAPEHDEAVIVARIDKVWRDGPNVRAEGVFDLEGENGREAHRLVHGGFLRGQSVTLDDISENDVELVWPEGSEESDDPMEAMMMMPELAIFKYGRIIDSLLTSMPALQEAFIELVPDVVEETVTAPEGPREDELVAGGVRYSGPPSVWFRNPKFTGPTPWTITDDGHCFGHLATWGTCHIGYSGQCVTPPREEDFSYFTTGEILTKEGERYPVGKLTFGINHAPSEVGVRPAIEHYENTNFVAADVACGSDRHGIWVSGAVRPGLTTDQLRALRAAAISGDWRRVGARLRLIAGLMVNVPGFPIPRMRTHIHDGVQTALVASGVVKDAPARVPMAVANRIAASIGRDLKARKAEIAARVHR